MMQKIIAGIFTLLLIPIFYIFFEKCPVSWSNAKANTQETQNKVSEETKPRGPDIGLVSDSPIINYIYRASGTGTPKLFGEGSVLHSGDPYKILFEPAKEGYVYIFQIDASHKIFRLFPTVDFKNADPNNVNPVKKRQQYFVPAESWSFKLDKTTGQETIYFVVTSQPDSTFENHYQTMLAEQKNRNLQDRFTAREKWDTTMKLRGSEVELIADMVLSRSPIQFEEQGHQFSVIPQYLKGLCEGCVYIVNFEHRQ